MKQFLPGAFLGVMLERLPSAALNQAMIVELLIGSICRVMLPRLNEIARKPGGAGSLTFQI